eukprot:gene7177-7983_t
MDRQILQAAKVVEECIDAEMDRMDRLDTDDIEALREKRLQELKRQSEKREEWISKGHGKYTEVPDEKDFFEEAKGHERLVCHFFRDSTFRCKILDQHLHTIARKHLETKFIKIDAEKALFLCQKLRVKVLPTLALIKDGKAKDYIVGFDDLGGVDEFPTEMLQWRLGLSDIINYKGDKPSLKNGKDEKNAGIFNFAKKKGKTIRGGGAHDDEDYDDDDDDY